MATLKPFKLKPGQKVWLTSDTHFQHKNIAGPKVSSWKSGYRDFDSVSEMDETIIKTINKYVKYDDVLFHAGDFSFGDKSKIPYIRSRLKVGEIHLIRGNHDEHIYKFKDSFTSIQDYWEGNIEGTNLIIFHYSMRVWNGSHKGFLLAYGHSHSSIEHSPHGKSMDVGIDNAYKLFGEYRPFSLEEFVSLMDKRSIAFLDHHDKHTNVR